MNEISYSQPINGIIVEGGEQQGKSTFIEKLQNEINLPFYHYSHLPEDFDYFDDYFKQIKKYAELGQGIIFDRHYLSELVYGKILRDGPRITPEKLEKIERRLSQLGYFIVLLDRGEHEWEQRKEEAHGPNREMVQINYELNKSIQKGFKQACQENISLPYVIVDAFDERSVMYVAKLYTMRMYEIQAKIINAETGGKFINHMNSSLHRKIFPIN